MTLTDIRRSTRWFAAGLVLSLLVGLGAPASAGVVGKLNLGISLQDSKTADLAPGIVDLIQSIQWAITSGTGAGQADLLWYDSRTLSASATEDLDVAGVLANVFGTVTAVKIKAVIISAAAANTNNVNLTRPATNGVPLFLAVSDGLPVLPGGFFVWVGPGAGVTVTAGTGDLLTLTNSAGGTSVTYTVIIIGTTA